MGSCLIARQQENAQNTVFSALERTFTIVLFVRRKDEDWNVNRDLCAAINHRKRQRSRMIPSNQCFSEISGRAARVPRRNSFAFAERKKCE